MKKMLLYLGLIVGIFAVIFVLKTTTVSSSTENPYHMKEKDLHSLTRKQLDDPNYQNIILPKDLDNMLSSKSTGFVYYFSPDCPHCRASTPYLMPLSKDLGVDMKQFNLLEFTDGWDRYHINATPTLIYYKEGKEVERIEGGLLIKNDKPTDDSIQYFKDFFNKYKDGAPAAKAS